MSRSKVWDEFTVYVDMQIGDEIHGIPMCGLCGNTGTINTEWVHDGTTHKIKSICICPNGRAWRTRFLSKPKWGGTSSSILVGRTTKDST